MFGAPCDSCKTLDRSGLRPLTYTALPYYRIDVLYVSEPKTSFASLLCACALAPALPEEKRLC